MFTYASRPELEHKESHSGQFAIRLGELCLIVLVSGLLRMGVFYETCKCCKISGDSILNSDLLLTWKVIRRPISRLIWAKHSKNTRLKVEIRLRYTRPLNCNIFNPRVWDNTLRYIIT